MRHLIIHDELRVTGYVFSAFSLTIYNSSTGLYTLQVMAVIALAGMPVVVGYTIFVYRLFKGKAGAVHHY
jgi:cytochrome bd ubiquinol oxidase subunit II